MLAPPVIGLTGQARSGKDTFYRLVLAPRGYIRIALADPVRALGLALRLPRRDGLKGRVLALAGLEEDGKAYYYAWYGQAKSPEVRKTLQLLGTELGRQEIDPGIWLYIALQEVKRIVEAGGRVAITDIRFPNEAAAIRGDTSYLASSYPKGLTPIGEALVRTWDEGGLAVPPGMGVVLRIRRPGEGLEGELGEHVSERSLEGVAWDHEVVASSLIELKRAGEALMGPVEDYL